MSRYNRLVDRQPFKLRVIGTNINRGIVVSVASEFTHTTFKNRLFRPIGAGNMLALRTLLRSVTGVNENNTDSHSLRLVFNKCLQLSKAPFVKPLALGFFQFDSATNICQIFKHKSLPRFHRLNKSFAQNMVTIASETSLSARSALQFALGRTSAFRLKFRAQYSMSALHFFPMFRTIKLSPAIGSRIFTIPKSTPTKLSSVSLGGIS